MKFKEIQRAIEKFTQDQLLAREARLADPHLKRTLEQTKILLEDDVKRVCRNGLDALFNFSLGALKNMTIEGGKNLGSVIGHNFSVKNPKKKRSYNEVSATVIKEFLVSYVKGSWDVLKLTGNLSIVLGRATVLGTRYLIGK